MPRKAPGSHLSPQVEAAMEALRAERQQKLDALATRDAATPPWLKALRQYIDATIEHHWEENTPDSEGYLSSDHKGRGACEALWTQVVDEERASRIPRISERDLHNLEAMRRQVEAIGEHDDERRERLGLHREI